jgi:hypothetical protein
MIAINISAFRLKFLAASALLLVVLFGILIWILRPGPLPDLLQGVPVEGGLARWDQTNSAMTEHIRRKLPLRSMKENVVESLRRQGFKATGPGEDDVKHFTFERQAFPCVERFLIQLKFDEHNLLQDVLGRYGTVCL